MTDALLRMKVADPGAVLDSYPHHLSGGLAQRVAIALAVVTEPRVVLADECTTALDVSTQSEVVSLLRKLVDESRVALVFVTHNILLRGDICDRVVVMYAGQAVDPALSAASCTARSILHRRPPRVPSDLERRRGVSGDPRGPRRWSLRTRSGAVRGAVRPSRRQCTTRNVLVAGARQRRVQIVQPLAPVVLSQ